MNIIGLVLRVKNAELGALAIKAAIISQKSLLTVKEEFSNSAFRPEGLEGVATRDLVSGRGSCYFDPMRCIVTAGPTYEPLDQVRRLTNFSSGQLGSELANFLTSRGHDVTLLIGQQPTVQGERRARRVETFTTTAALRDRIRSLAVEPINAVFHG